MCLACCCSCLSFGLFCCVTFYFLKDPFLDRFVYEEHAILENYFVNTNGCRIMTTSPYCPDVRYHWWELRNYICPSEGFVESIHNESGKYLKTRDDNRTDLNCSYYVVERKTDFENRLLYHQEIEMLDRRSFEMEVHGDIVRAVCFNGSNFYNGVHFFVKKPSVKRRRRQGLPKLQSATSPDSLSVLILGLDSVSHLHFLRAMVHTYAFLQNLPHVEFMGFSRVGSSSFESMIPLLTGWNSQEIKDFCLDSKRGLDRCPFLWKMFQNAGYETAFGEDNIDMGLFTLDKPGFEHQPTDYYLRPALLEMWQQTRKKIRHGAYCNEEDTYATVLLNFLYKQLPLHERHRFFSFLWWTQGIHAVFQYGRVLDKPFLEMFQKLMARGILNNTLILFVSNYGLKDGDSNTFSATNQAQMEVSQPLAIISYPEWLEERYPLAVKNLKMNSRRLVTAYDLHATLLDMPHLAALEDQEIRLRSQQLESPLLKEDLPRGISLFLPIPEQRDCSMAHIPAEYCLCHKPSSIPFKDINVVRAARFIILQINKLVASNHPPCQLLSLDRVLAAELWHRSLDQHQSEVRLQVQTLPGLGQFEGVVRFTDYTFALNGPIRRLNEDANESSYCIQNILIEKYCFCR
ncbi:uncharacterized protein [Drosophila pseudoobscura]|uniref:Uncharacterized protein n=1 Tax=Drosophila pseudoobscura pseudoobscura TaxID=46245 RepID=A0A6I8UL60_DROPS|nr:uncharacterized protein LOC4818040 [Drosophila pseudoobscura]